MATEKRLIDANALFVEMERRFCVNCNYFDGRCRDCQYAMAVDMLVDATTVDAVEVVRCKDCKFYTHAKQSTHWNEKALACFRKARTTVLPDDFCSFGERKDND